MTLSPKLRFNKLLHAMTTQPELSESLQKTVKHWARAACYGDTRTRGAAAKKNYVDHFPRGVFDDQPLTGIVIACGL